MKYIAEIVLDGNNQEFEVETENGFLLVFARTRNEAATGARDYGYRVLSVVKRGE